MYSFEKAMRRDSRLIVSITEYSLTPAHAAACVLGRPKHVLSDPADPLT